MSTIQSSWSLGTDFPTYRQLDYNNKILLDAISASDPITDKIFNALGPEFYSVYSAFDTGLLYEFPSFY